MQNRFGGGTPRCVSCDDLVYKMEEMTVENQVLHKTCFKCTHCKRLLSLSNFAGVGGKFYCQTHFIELFHSGGGKYSVFGDDGFKHKESGSFSAVNVGPDVAAKIASNPSKAPAAVPAQPAKEDVKHKGEQARDQPKDKHLSIRERMKLYEQNTSSSPEPEPLPQDHSVHKDAALQERLETYKRNAAHSVSGDESEGSETAEKQPHQVHEEDKSIDEDHDEDIAEQEDEEQEAQARTRFGVKGAAVPRVRALSAASLASENSSNTLEPVDGSKHAQTSTPAPSTIDSACGEDEPVPPNSPLKASMEDTTDNVTSLLTIEEQNALLEKCDTLETKSNLLTSENAQLKAQVAQLKAKVSKLKQELGEQTAKALESDEWVAKISKDFEAQSGSKHNSLSEFLAQNPS